MYDIFPAVCCWMKASWFPRIPGHFVTKEFKYMPLGAADWSQIDRIAEQSRRISVRMPMHCMYRCWNIVAMRADIMSSADSLQSCDIAAGQAACSNDRSAMPTHRRVWICDACYHVWRPKTSMYTVKYLAHALHCQRQFTGHRIERAPCQGKDALQAASAHDPLRTLCSLGTTSFCNSLLSTIISFPMETALFRLRSRIKTLARSFAREYWYPGVSTTRIYARHTCSLILLGFVMFSCWQ